MDEEMHAALARHRELRERLVALTDGAESVLRAGSLEAVRQAIVELAARVLPADAYALWALDTEAGLWRIVHARGLGNEFVGVREAGSEAQFSEPLVADGLELDLLAHRTEAYRQEGIRSFISVPLPIDGLRRGALVAYHRTPHSTTRAEVEVAAALGHLSAAAVGNAEARERQEDMRADAELHGRRMKFLADASTLLAGLDVWASFQKLAALAVPTLGDWCAIDVEQDGTLARVAVAHPEPAMLARAQELYERYPVHRDSSSGVARVLRTSQPELHSQITDEMLELAARDAAHLELLRALAFKSAILAPLSARGRTLGVLTVVSSTDARHYDQADLQFVEEVARRAAIAIDNARLYEEAQRANRAKDEFLALLSHELRTPLNAIMGWTQVLMNLSSSPGGDPLLQRGLGTIRRNARLQAELVDSLLDVARVSTGGLPLWRETVDAGEVAAAAIEGIRPSAAERGIEITLHEPAGCRLLADPNRLQQILNNLLVNAVKFTQQGGRIDVRLARTASGCEIEVSDTGSGITAEFLPHVFERFRQADSSTTRSHGGLGLGLWLVQELARAHGGSVTASSAGHGLGSTFRVVLPLGEGPGPAPQAPDEARAGSMSSEIG
jgi:signal transduction histidine kinase